MKLWSKLISIALLASCTFPSIAQDESSELTTYVKYLVGYLGYDVNKDPVEKNGTVSQNVTDINAIETVQKYLVTTFLGAIPVTAMSQALAQLVPTTDSPINTPINAPFIDPAYSSVDQGPITTNSLIDQKTYQNDPVTQAVLNILATPERTECMDYYGVEDKKCDLLTQERIIENIVGTFPSKDDKSKNLFSYEYNKPLLSQLNSNILISPLLYSTTDLPEENSSVPATGLTAKSQAENAANFIRYVTTAVTPIALPKFKDYYDTYQLANTEIKDDTPAEDQTNINTARSTLANYFANLRTYAAQASVGYGDLYWILSKRMPQKGTGSTPTSQALNEFNMATWRINPQNGLSSDTTPWLNKINDASAATVQKEIAILLAEINYQMYLSRQQDERLLLTNAILLIQNTKSSQPAAFTASTSPTVNVGSP